MMDLVVGQMPFSLLLCLFMMNQYMVLFPESFEE